MLDFPVTEIALLTAWIVGAGAVVGILAGLFGIGGGAVIIPILYEVFRLLGVPEDVRMQLCVGTSLAIIVPTNIRSYLVHKKRGAVLGQVMRIWTIPALVGVAAGSVIATYAPSGIFKVAFVVFASLIAAQMLLGGYRWRLGKELPGVSVQCCWAFGIGLFSSLVGVSGGAISTAVLTLYGKPIQFAVATSAGLGVPITIAGTVGYMIAGWPHMAQMPPVSIGFVSFLGVLLMAPMSSYMATYGARLAHRLPRRVLEIAFGIFLMLIASRFIVSLL